MPRNRKKKENPTIPALNRVESLISAYLVNRRQTLRSLEPILREDPSTQAELNRVGGLARVLTLSSDDDQERLFLPRFINLQTSLFLDRVTQGDITTTPTLQTMFDSSRNNNRILTAVAQSLDDCCAAIQTRLDELEKLINQRFRALRDLIVNRFSALYDKLIDLK